MATRITLGNLVVDKSEFKVQVGSDLVVLTFVEFELLYMLARRPGNVCSLARLAFRIWEDPSDETRKLAVHMSRLRRKLAGMSPWRLEAVTKRGYVLRETLGNSDASAARGRRMHMR